MYHNCSTFPKYTVNNIALKNIIVIEYSDNTYILYYINTYI